MWILITSTHIKTLGEPGNHQPLPNIIDETETVSELEEINIWCCCHGSQGFGHDDDAVDVYLQLKH